MNNSMVPAREVVSDRYQDVKIFLPSRDKGKSVEKSFNLSEESELEHIRLPNSVKNYLGGISQVGLKDIWLGSTPDIHDRWEHSIGAFNIAMMWLEVLYDDERIPRHLKNGLFRSLQDALLIVAHAVLLHDYGHLPFSHLLDEALDYINWIPHRKNQESLEYAVLYDRITQNGELSETFKKLAGDLSRNEDLTLEPSDIRSIILSLIYGEYSIPWVQTIVNSPIDADKIDYIWFDQIYLEKLKYPVSTRITFKPELDNIMPWLSDFLYDQRVNHAGMLCLSGRSAIAASHLWRERIFLYDRFYLAPEIRVPERMAIEIVQQFIIRSVMSYSFAAKLRENGLEVKTLLELTQEEREIRDIIEKKYNLVKDLMSKFKVTTRKREFAILERMIEFLNDHANLDKGYKGFINKCYECLKNLKDRKITLSDLARNSLVGSPLQIDRRYFHQAREALRSLQHIYSREVLIDIVALPRVLSVPPGYRFRTSNGRREIHYSILVPRGEVSSWGPQSQASVPLSDESVKELERAHGRICVIAPNSADTPKAKYIFDRVRAVLRRNNIPFEESDSYMSME